MHKLKLVLVTVLAATLVGCAGVKEVGRVGNVTFSEVKGRSNFGRPAWTIPVAQADGQDPVVLGVFAGNGAVPALVQGGLTAGGIIGGAALLRPSVTEVDNGSSSSSLAKGGNADANANANANATAKANANATAVNKPRVDVDIKTKNHIHHNNVFPKWKH